MTIDQLRRALMDALHDNDTLLAAYHIMQLRKLKGRNNG